MFAVLFILLVLAIAAYCTFCHKTMTPATPDLVSLVTPKPLPSLSTVTVFVPEGRIAAYLAENKSIVLMSAPTTAMLGGYYVTIKR